MSKGMIVVGYQGIGKSTLAKNGSGYIDLESGNFWIDGKRADDWYIPYCNIAIHLAQQGYVVFTSSHQVVRDYLASEPRNVDLVVCVPAPYLKDEWIKKLEDRYNESKLEKDYKAWMNAVDRYEDNINEILSSKGFYTIIIGDIPYNLHSLIQAIRPENQLIHEPVRKRGLIYDQSSDLIYSYENKSLMNTKIPDCIKRYIIEARENNYSFNKILFDISTFLGYVDNCKKDNLTKDEVEFRDFMDNLEDIAIEAQKNPKPEGE